MYQTLTLKPELSSVFFISEMSNLEQGEELSSYRSPPLQSFPNKLMRGKSLHTRVWREAEWVPAITAGTKYQQKEDAQ